ncbi:MAG: diguanylate cyclase [Alphaproteobacteria bacterium]|nr:diguanylate cyclase [Alphaproteobacteria bacterium]
MDPRDTGLARLSLERQAGDVHERLVSRLLEQGAQISDHLINEELLKELVRQFVESERNLAEAHRQVLALSRTDGLTGIANRRWFDECLGTEWSRSARVGAPVGLLLLDIDSFKLFNDNYGHPAGDETLRRVARAVAEVVGRPPDLAARYGGEEIVCLLPETSLDRVVAVGQTVLAAVRALEIPHAHSKAAAIVTASIGAASLIATPDAPPTLLVKTADGALYRAKEGGRNRVVAAG